MLSDSERGPGQTSPTNCSVYVSRMTSDIYEHIASGEEEKGLGLCVPIKTLLLYPRRRINSIVRRNPDGAHPTT